MREQGKGVSAFPANPLRARFICRALERRCVEEKPPATASFNTYEYLNTFTSTHKSKRKRFDLPRNPFFNWRSGKALPNKSTRMLFDNLFDGHELGSKWGERCIDSREQTLLCALDLISNSSQPRRSECLFEAREIMDVTSQGFNSIIPRMIDLSRPKTTSYQGELLVKNSAQKQDGSLGRYNDLNPPRYIAYPHIHNHITPYNSISAIQAGFMYLLKPNNISEHSDEVSLAMLLELISGVLALYIFMLHKNPIEFSSGGPVVNLYRLIFRSFFTTKPEAKGGNRSRNLFNEVLYNDFPQLDSQASDEGFVRLEKLISLFKAFTSRSGLDRAEFMEAVDPIDPENSVKVRDWWLNS